MSKFEITTKREYINIVNLLKKYDYAYFVESSPLVSDSVYDDYYFAVQKYEEGHPLFLLPDSPTQKVGADGKTGKRNVRHRTPMMSTQKCKSIADVIKWMRSTRNAARKILRPGDTLGGKPFSIEWKYDGCSCSLVYQDGVLVEASTRGDYMNGQDILHHVKNILSIPQVLRPGRRYTATNKWEPLNEQEVIMGRIEVRGEILMSYANLEKTNGLYKDCRTAASAILNTETVTPHDTLLTFRAWQLITEQTNGSQGLPYIGPDESAIGALDVLTNVLGFEVDGYDWCDEELLEDIIGYLAKERGVLPYPVDGLVIKMENKKIWDMMGKTEHHPKFCIAYKFPPQTAETTITKIEITVGATGKRTPIIWFNPVTMNGKTYEKASGGSEDTVAKNGFAVGKRVQFSLANDVIPHIDKVIE